MRRFPHPIQPYVRNQNPSCQTEGGPRYGLFYRKPPVPAGLSGGLRQG
jgi:hypothetical protein